MTQITSLDALGSPDLEIAQLRVWVHERPYAASDEPYDRDWLVVTAHCANEGAAVVIHGPFAASSGVERLADGCDIMYQKLSGKAWLASDELNLTVRLEASGQLGHVQVVVEITPNHLTQEHRFEFNIDQTYLPEITRQCRAILARYPNPHAKRTGAA
jgi:hypothetical protein